jgi:nitrate reductase alpha subunit
VPREKVIAVAQQFAENAHKTKGKSMIIIGAAMNHWYHMDMNYRGVIKMLMMCGCVGVSAAAAGRTTWARKNCGRRPAGHRWPSRWTGTVRHGT